MSKEEYANYDYQTTTVPLKTEYGVTIGTETKSTYKLCTKDCVYKNNWNELKKWLEELDKTFCEIMTRDNSEFYHFQRGELVFLRNIKLKMQELENKQCHTTLE